MKTILLIKKANENAVVPVYATEGSAGADLHSCIDASLVLKAGEVVIVPTGISMEIPKGFEVQIRSRSGLAAKNGIFVLNSPGTIDEDFRGEIKVILANFSKTDFTIENNMRIAQMVLTQYNKADFVIATDLTNTTRGSGGFGSTGVSIA